MDCCIGQNPAQSDNGVKRTSRKLEILSPGIVYDIWLVGWDWRQMIKSETYDWKMRIRSQSSKSILQTATVRLVMGIPVWRRITEGCLTPCMQEGESIYKGDRPIEEASWYARTHLVYFLWNVKSNSQIPEQRCSVLFHLSLKFTGVQ